MQHINEVVSVMESRIERKILAVYLRGSRLRGLQSDQSDYDVTIVINPTRRELLCKKDFSHRVKLDEYNTEGNVFTTSHVYALLLKGSPLVLEMIHKYPVFCHEDFQPIAHYLYTNRSKIMEIKSKSFVTSCRNMALAQLKRTTKNGNGYVKNAVMALILEYYIKSVLKGNNLDAFIPFSGADKDRLMAYKFEDGVANFDSLGEISKLDFSNIQDGDEELFYELEKMILSIVR